MLGLVVLALVTAFGLQFRPSRARVWQARWKRWWLPALRAMAAMAAMAWQGFIREPIRRLWNRETAARESKRSLDAAIDKMLGRE